MKLLKNKNAWDRWVSVVNKSQCAEIKPPVKYPCFGYLVVGSFSYEEETALYLYAEDLVKMGKQLI